MNPNEKVEDGAALPAAKEDRRKFLALTAKVAGVLAALGVTAEVLRPRAEAEDKDKSSDKPDKKQQALRDLLGEAIKSQDMKAAIEKHGKDAELTEEQEKALLSLTKEELSTISAVREKMKPIMGGGNTGYFIF